MYTYFHPTVASPGVVETGVGSGGCNIYTSGLTLMISAHHDKPKFVCDGGMGVGVCTYRHCHDDLHALTSLALFVYMCVGCVGVCGGRGVYLQAWPQ